MNKYNSESWAKDANRPAIEGKYGDLHIFMDHIELCIEPTDKIRREANDERIERINERYKQLFKKK